MTTGSQPPISVYTDDQVASQVLEIIRKAERFVVLVSPYVSAWGHLQDELRLAIKRNVQVYVLIRYDQVEKNQDVAWLLDTGAKVQALE